MRPNFQFRNLPDENSNTLGLDPQEIELACWAAHIPPTHRNQFFFSHMRHARSPAQIGCFHVNSSRLTHFSSGAKWSEPLHTPASRMQWETTACIHPAAHITASHANVYTTAAAVVLVDLLFHCEDRQPLADCARRAEKTPHIHEHMM